MKWLALFLVGCAAQPIDQIGIACTTDADCPDNTWCDMNLPVVRTCRSYDALQPPAVTFDGFVVNKQVVSTISVPTHDFTSHDFQLTNTGSEATTFVTITGPKCVYAGSETRGDGERVAADSTFVGQMDTNPDVGCASPATLQIDIMAGGRPFSFTATITITP